LAGLALAYAAESAAQPSLDDQDKCWDTAEQFAPEQQVAGCTALLEADGVPEEDRAYAIALRGWSYHELGDLDRALADYSEKIRLQPEAADGYGWRGSAYLDQGDYPNALADYTRAIELDPESPDIAIWYGDRGIAHDSLGEHEQAIADFTRSINLAPDVAVIWNSRCWARAVWGRELVEALDDCNEALALDPEDFNAWDSRGLVHLRREEWAEALADYQASLDLMPSSSALYGHGIALSRLGRSAEAEEDFASAAEIDPGIAETYAGFGITP
jgi:tetratricopeptide (TPR) repeat protein